MEKSNATLLQNAKNMHEGIKKLIEENSELKRENERLMKGSKKPKFEFFSKK